MDAAREDRLERLFEEASAMVPEQRDAFLKDACVEDPELRFDLEGLLADAAEARDFVDRVVGAVVARCAGVVLSGSRSVVDNGAARAWATTLPTSAFSRSLAVGAWGWCTRRWT